jgi:hypothetical protein
MARSANGCLFKHTSARLSLSNIVRLPPPPPLRNVTQLTTYPDTDLTMHHTIEERHIFPLLGKRMPAFSNKDQEDKHLESHRGIHRGALHLCLLSFLLSFFLTSSSSILPLSLPSLLRPPSPPFNTLLKYPSVNPGLHSLQTLLKSYKSTPSSYSPDEMKACLDGFREVLFRHLDEEVCIRFRFCFFVLFL